MYILQVSIAFGKVLHFETPLIDFVPSLLFVASHFSAVSNLYGKARPTSKTPVPERTSRRRRDGGRKSDVAPVAPRNQRSGPLGFAREPFRCDCAATRSLLNFPDDGGAFDLILGKKDKVGFSCMIFVKQLVWLLIDLSANILNH